MGEATYQQGGAATLPLAGNQTQERWLHSSCLVGSDEVPFSFLVFWVSLRAGRLKKRGRKEDLHFAASANVVLFGS